MKKKLDKEEAVSALRGKIERSLANNLNPSFRKSTLPQNRQPIVLRSNSQQENNDFVGELAF